MPRKIDRQSRWTRDARVYTRVIGGIVRDRGKKKEGEKKKEKGKKKKGKKERSILEKRVFERVLSRCSTRDPDRVLFYPLPKSRINRVNSFAPTSMRFRDG